jgi:type II secretory pathway component PulJ
LRRDDVCILLNAKGRAQYFHPGKKGGGERPAEKGRMATTTVDEWEAIALVGGPVLSIYHLLTVSFGNPPVRPLFQSFHAAESIVTLAALAGSAFPVLLLPSRAAFLLIHVSLFLIVNACTESMYSEQGGTSPSPLLYASAQMAAHSFLPSGHRLADFLIPVLVSFACMLHTEPVWNAKWAAVPAPSLIVLLSIYSSERGKRFVSTMTLEEPRSGDDDAPRCESVSLRKWAKRAGFVAGCARISAMEKDAAAVSVATMMVANILVLAWTVRSHSKRAEELQRSHSKRTDELQKRNASLAQFCTLPVADARSDAEPDSQPSPLFSPVADARSDAEPDSQPSLPSSPVLDRIRDLDSASNNESSASMASTTSSSRSDRLRRENVILKRMLERLRKEEGDLRARIEAGSKQHQPSTFPRFSAHGLPAYTLERPPFPTASAFSLGTRMARRRSV